MAEKKQEGTNTQTVSKTSHMSFPSTYSVLTAERLLEQFNVKLTSKRIKQQVFHTDTFYHKLMFLPARAINLNVHYEQCRDFQAYAQQKLIHYLFSGETSKSEEEPGNQMRDDIENKRLKLIEMGKEMAEWEHKEASFKQTFYSSLEERLKAWHETVKAVSKEAALLLKNESVALKPGFTDALYPVLLDYGAGIRIPDALKSELKLKDPIGIVEKSVISLLCGDKDQTVLDKAKMKKLKAPFSALDKKLLLIIDDLGGMNASENAKIEAMKEEIQGMTKQFANDAALISRTIHEYFQRYGENDLKVDTDQKAFHQGVDQEVADDYNALKGGMSG